MNISLKIFKGKIVLLVCSIIFALISICLWGVPILKFDGFYMVGGSLKEMNGLTLAFGGKIINTQIISGGSKTTEVPITPVPAITAAYITMCVSSIILIVTMLFIIKNKQNVVIMILIIIGTLGFIYSAVISFLTEPLFTNSYQEDIINAYKRAIVSDYNICPYYGICLIATGFLTSLQLLYFTKRFKQSF